MPSCGPSPEEHLLSRDVPRRPSGAPRRSRRRTMPRSPADSPGWRGTSFAKGREAMKLPSGNIPTDRSVGTSAPPARRIPRFVQGLPEALLWGLLAACLSWLFMCATLPLLSPILEMPQGRPKQGLCALPAKPGPPPPSLSSLQGPTLQRKRPGFSARKRSHPQPGEAAQVAT